MKNRIRFLSMEDALAIHRDQIVRYGGSLELRDRGLLESALAMPMSMFGGAFLHADLFEMAAAYLYHLVLNHPFIDGNKRVAVQSANVFLFINGYEMQAPQKPYEELVLQVVLGKVDKRQVASFFARHSVPTDLSMS